MIELTPRGVPSLVREQHDCVPVTLHVLSVSPGGFTHVSDGVFFLSVLVHESVERGDVIAVTGWTRSPQSDLISVTHLTLLQKISEFSGSPRLFVQTNRRLSEPLPAVRTPERPLVKHTEICKSQDISRSPPTVLVRGRVISVSPVRNGKNARVRFLTVELVDAGGNDFRLVFFNEAADQCRAEISADAVYTFSGGQRKGSEILYYKFPIIEKLPNDPRIPSSKFVETTKISELLVAPMPCAPFNVLALVVHVGTLQEISGGHVIRKLSLVDDSFAHICLTLWDERSRTLDGAAALGAVVVVTKCTLREFRDERCAQIGVDGDLRVQSGHPLSQRLLVGTLLDFPVTNVVNACAECGEETKGTPDGKWKCKNAHERGSCRVLYDVKVAFSLSSGAQTFALADDAASKLLHLDAEDFEFVSESERTSIFRSLCSRRFVLHVQNAKIVNMRPLVVH